MHGAGVVVPILYPEREDAAALRAAAARGSRRRGLHGRARAGRCSRAFGALRTASRSLGGGARLVERRALALSRGSNVRILIILVSRLGAFFILMIAGNHRRPPLLVLLLYSGPRSVRRRSRALL